jgi:soluble lytic murein transglycosylase
LALAVAVSGALAAGIAFAGIPTPAPRPAAAPPRAQARPVPLPTRRPQIAQTKSVGPKNTYAEATRGVAAFKGASAVDPLARPLSGPFAIAARAVTSEADVNALKEVIRAARSGKTSDADAAERSIHDPLARKLAEYVILRSNDTSPSFPRYAAFLAANPDWPHAALFRRRAENALWNDQLDDATVRAFFAHHAPTTAKGRYMLARALLAAGDRAGAAELVRYAWRNEDCSHDVEKRVLEMFGDLLTRADHKARMEHRLYDDDAEAGLRAAERLGGTDLLVARARAAVIRRKHNAKDLLDDVPRSARSEPGYIFARAQWLRREGKPEEAGRLILSASHDAAALVDANQWWLEERVLIRKLLDDHDAQTAYRIARDAPDPAQGNWRVDKYFTAGWIALRFLHDPKTAAAHFAKIVQGTKNPHALSRGGYWQGRAADALGDHAHAKRFYEMAAHYTATYYGQLARARLGLSDLGLRGPPALMPKERDVLSRLEVVRAVELLYKLDERDMIASIYADLGETANDIAGMAMLGELAAKHKDGRAMVLLGSGAYGRGLPLDYYAYPVVGLPHYTPVAPPIEPAVTYSIARQESHFNQKVVSPAHAMGLMQVTPEAARDTARRFKVHYDRKRLLTDPVYNMQMGAAELSNLLRYYNGSYLLTFAGYNAGMGRVRQWMKVYGDPRDPDVDPVDWVERLPFSETRNYVMRIMENLQVYRARFGGGHGLVIEADLRRGASN